MVLTALEMPQSQRTSTFDTSLVNSVALEAAWLHKTSIQ